MRDREVQVFDEDAVRERASERAASLIDRAG
jgi:5-methylthioadenosine/S-adenosylhomocysteine deaminase